MASRVGERPPVSAFGDDPFSFLPSRSPAPSPPPDLVLHIGTPPPALEVPIYEEVDDWERGCCNQDKAFLNRIFENNPALRSLDGAGIDLSARQIARLFPEITQKASPPICIISSISSIIALVLSILPLTGVNTGNMQTKWKAGIGGVASILPAIIEQELIGVCENKDRWKNGICEMSNTKFFETLLPPPFIAAILFTGWNWIPAERIEKWGSKTKARKVIVTIIEVAFKALLYSRSVQLLAQNVIRMDVAHPLYYEIMYITAGSVATLAQATKCRKTMSVFMEYLYGLAVAIAAGFSLYNKFTDPNNKESLVWPSLQAATFGLTFLTGVGATWRLSGQNVKARVLVKDYSPSVISNLRNEPSTESVAVVDEQKLEVLIQSQQLEQENKNKSKRRRCHIL